MHALADTIFVPVTTMLQTVLNSLSNVHFNLASGLNINNYLGHFVGLGSSWVFLIKSLVLCFVCISVFMVAKTGYSLYLQLKQGVKWW
ncbi:hypothetical protein [Dehalobacter sp.]|uniref:hypothetical protein n=1 Tax=Dehalobacter sp. TaxID=1962289 RepID=UPI00030EB792|nr:hypothetical protein [Dehalobacter sp.]MDJ0304555.1 hypothetical protein [Dehalobacter sp.]